MCHSYNKDADNRINRKYSYRRPAFVFHEIFHGFVFAAPVYQCNEFFPMLTVFHVVIGVIIAGGSDFVLVSVGTPFTSTRANRRIETRFRVLSDSMM